MYRHHVRRQRKAKSNEKVFSYGKQDGIEINKPYIPAIFLSPGSLVGITTDKVLEFNDRLTILML